jgi:hypothetical protein
MLRLGGRHAEALAAFDAHLGEAARCGMGFEARIARADRTALGDSAATATPAALAVACWDEDRVRCDRLRRALLADAPLSDGSGRRRPAGRDPPSVLLKRQSPGLSSQLLPPPRHF